MTAFDRIKSMSKDELCEFIQAVYQWGHINEQCATTDECFYKRLLDLPAHRVDGIVDAYHNLKLYQVKVYPIDGGEPFFMSMKYYSEADAEECLMRFNHAQKTHKGTYKSAKYVYKICQ